LGAACTSCMGNCETSGACTTQDQAQGHVVNRQKACQPH
jgi:hypothetical protein